MVYFGSDQFGIDSFGRGEVGRLLLYDRLPILHKGIDREGGRYLERLLKAFALEIDHLWDRLSGIRNLYDGALVYGGYVKKFNVIDSEEIEDEYFGKILRLYIDQENGVYGIEDLRLLENLDIVKLGNLHGFLIRVRVRDWSGVNSESRVYIDVKIPMGAGYSGEIEVVHSGLLRWLADEFGVILGVNEKEVFSRRLLRGIWGTWDYREAAEAVRVRARMAGYYIGHILCGGWVLDSRMDDFIPSLWVFLGKDDKYYTCEEGRWVRFDDIRGDIRVLDPDIGINPVGILDYAWMGKDLSNDGMSTGLYFGENVWAATEGVTSESVVLNSYSVVSDPTVYGLGSAKVLEFTIDSTQREIPIGYLTRGAFYLVEQEQVMTSEGVQWVDIREYAIIEELGYDSVTGLWRVVVDALDNEIPHVGLGYRFILKYKPERSSECYWCKSNKVIVSLYPSRDIVEYYNNDISKIYEQVQYLGENTRQLIGATSDIEVDLISEESVLNVPYDSVEVLGGRVINGLEYNIVNGKSTSVVGGWLYLDSNFLTTVNEEVAGVLDYGFPIIGRFNNNGVDEYINSLYVNEYIGNNLGLRYFLRIRSGVNTVQDFITVNIPINSNEKKWVFVQVYSIHISNLTNHYLIIKLSVKDEEFNLIGESLKSVDITSVFSVDLDFSLDRVYKGFTSDYNGDFKGIMDIRNIVYVKPVVYFIGGVLQPMWEAMELDNVRWLVWGHKGILRQLNELSLSNISNVEYVYSLVDSYRVLERLWFREYYRGNWGGDVKLYKFMDYSYGDINWDIMRGFVGLKSEYPSVEVNNFIGYYDEDWKGLYDR